MAHFRSVYRSAERPIILYDAPGRTGLHVTVDTYRCLADDFDGGDLDGARGLAVRLDPLVQALNGQGQQAVMAKAALKAAGRLDQTAMRLSDLGSDEGQVALARKGMKAAGLI